MRIQARAWAALAASSLAALAAACLATACGDDRPGPAEADVPSPDGAPAFDGGVPPSADATTPTDAKAEGGDGAAPDVTLCIKGATWSAPIAVALTGFDDALLGSVTPDELSMVWSTDGGGGSVTVSYVDRMSKTAAFAAPRTFTGSYALDRVAMSDDGLLLILVRSDRRGFVQRTRASRDDDFGPEEVAPFANIDEYATMTMPAAEAFGDPLLTDGRTFLYSQYGGGRTRTIQLTQRLFANDTWPVGQAIAANPALDAVGTLRRRPTGFALDQRTIFVFDEVSGMQRMAWTKAAPDDFQAFAPLVDRPSAVPNADCSRLYFVTSAGDGGLKGTGVSFVNRL